MNVRHCPICGKASVYHPQGHSNAEIRSYAGHSLAARGAVAVQLHLENGAEIQVEPS